MKEFDVRRAIGLDETLTTAQKYTLIMLCTRLDWHTWTGQVSARDIAKVSSQGERQVKRHLASLKRAGWLERLVELRSDTPRLHHKADTRLNVELVKSILDDRPQASAPAPVEAHSVTDDTSGESDTSGVYDMSDKGCKDDDKDTGVTDDTSGESDTSGVSDVTLGGCHKRHWGSVMSDTDEVSLSPPNNNNNQYNINLDQSPLNTPEAEPESKPREWRGELQEGYRWCNRCRQHVPLDEPHTYPYSQLICTDEDTTEKVLERSWDAAFDAHQPEPITEELREGLWRVSRIDSMLDYRREIHRECTHHKRYDVRDMLLIGDQYLRKMADELIAPKSAIDWATLQASGQLPSISTPAAPPKPSTTYIVTADEQRRIKEIDRAWATGADHHTTKVNGW